MSYKFFIALLFVALGTTLQVILGSASGLWMNFALAALVTAAFFVSILELISLILLSVFILSWQPALSVGLVLFCTLPFVLRAVRRFFPFDAWLMNGILILTGVSVLYLFFGRSVFWSEPGIFLWDIAASVGFGAVAFVVFRSSAERV